jgi:DNA-binding phage protein
MSQDELAPEQLKAIDALVGGSSHAEAARRAGVSRMTIYRWLSDVTFCDTLKACEHEALQSLSRRMLTLTEDAQKALTDAMRGDGNALAVRAAGIVLQHLAGMQEMATFEQRLRAIEAKYEAVATTGGQA